MFEDVLKRLEIEEVNSGVDSGPRIDPRSIHQASGGELASINPSTGQPIARVRMASKQDYEMIVEKAQTAFLKWRLMPPQKRGVARA